jgi:hypothetical protein
MGKRETEQTDRTISDQDIILDRNKERQKGGQEETKETVNERRGGFDR